MTVEPVELRHVIERELFENLLPFWRKRSVDHRNGGFIGAMTNDGKVHRDAPKGLILNARILWSFAALTRRFGDAGDRALARRAFDYLSTRFTDMDQGGFFWLLDPAGRPLDTTKKIYGQAFSIYALSEYYAATGDEAALDAARQTFHRIEQHAHDEEHGGYIESRARDWSPTADLRLSDKDMDVAKSMNNHLHVLEAYTGLYRVWPAPAVAQRLMELLDLFDEHLLERSKSGCHLRHFFDATWQPRSRGYTYGHDIEAAWLLYETAAALGGENRIDRVGARALELARSVLVEALDTEGALAYAGRDGVVTDSNREWWCQAEAVVGFWQAFELSHDEAFARAAARVLSFIRTRMVDRDHGEWFWRVFTDGSPDPAELKVSEWKGPYHNTRMCLEMLQRLDDDG